LLIDDVLRWEFLNLEGHNSRALQRGRKKAVKFLRVFLSLHSIQLIVISVLLITYLAATAENRANKTAPVQAPSRTEEESASRDNAQSLNRGKSLKAIISQSTATGIILEAHAVPETNPAPGQVNEIVAESSENESATEAGQHILNPRTAIIER
jgi:hypothetical protein